MSEVSRKASDNGALPDQVKCNYCDKGLVQHERIACTCRVCDRQYTFEDTSKWISEMKSTVTAGRPVIESLQCGHSFSDLVDYEVPCAKCRGTGYRN
jgi:hypothetical protein